MRQGHLHWIQGIVLRWSHFRSVVLIIKDENTAIKNAYCFIDLVSLIYGSRKLGFCVSALDPHLWIYLPFSHRGLLFPTVNVDGQWNSWIPQLIHGFVVAILPDRHWCHLTQDCRYYVYRPWPTIPVAHLRAWFHSMRAFWFWQLFASKNLLQTSVPRRMQQG